MRLLIAHNRYRPTTPSGENVVVDQEAAALASTGHTVRLFERQSSDIANWSAIHRATVPLKLLWSEESRKAMARCIREFSPDIVHIHNTFPLISPSILYACRDASVPVVTTIHNYRPRCASGELFRSGNICHDCKVTPSVPALEHGCYRGSRLATVPIVVGTRIHTQSWLNLVSAYIFVSRAQMELLAPVGYDASRCFVKHNFVPAPPGRRAQATHRVLYVGRLDTAKGLPFLMEAWDAFRSQNPSSCLRLAIAGAGPLSAEVTRWSSSRPSVDMLGQLPREHVSDLMAKSRAVVVPSQWEETFGMVAVEAMAVGTGVIAADHGGLADIVTSNIDGSLFPPTDQRALVNLLNELDASPAVWDRYGTNALKTYGERFTKQRSVQRLEEIYEYARTHPIKHQVRRKPTLEPQPRSTDSIR